MSAWGSDPSWGDHIEPAPAEHARKARELLTQQADGDLQAQTATYLEAIGHALTGLLLLEIGRESSS